MVTASSRAFHLIKSLICLWYLTGVCTPPPPPPPPPPPTDGACVTSPDTAAAAAAAPPPSAAPPADAVGAAAAAAAAGCGRIDGSFNRLSAGAAAAAAAAVPAVPAGWPAVPAERAPPPACGWPVTWLRGGRPARVMLEGSGMSSAVPSSGDVLWRLVVVVAVGNGINLSSYTWWWRGHWRRALARPGARPGVRPHSSRCVAGTQSNYPSCTHSGFPAATLPTHPATHFGHATTQPPTCTARAADWPAAAAP